MVKFELNWIIYVCNSSLFTQISIYVGRWWPYFFNNYYFITQQSFFGFGQSAEIDIILDGAATRRTTEVKTEDGKKERLFLFFDGETLSGKVSPTI